MLAGTNKLLVRDGTPDSAAPTSRGGHSLRPEALPFGNKKIAGLVEGDINQRYEKRGRQEEWSPCLMPLAGPT